MEMRMKNSEAKATYCRQVEERRGDPGIRSTRA
jgi:hypothetical protein